MDKADFAVVRVAGIEPAPQAWEAHVLPLNYTRIADGPRGNTEAQWIGNLKIW
jgi:hypothetical protein